MLQLNNICKSYTTGNFTQKALDDVSIAFRDNEFVAILGPSGSGKTTMLNIVGGLDHYDSGDLVIDGISTKQFKDRDWDAYRNNRVGFVFQSYNLIPHQTVLANVELALTLSGVSRDERRQRAREALERVGLGDHVDKKPAQLSGGQMQRVAIARALINDPEILLADEPTGALDSKTSVQIMDLLTEIAEDRLVVMVTHNPELAEQYATRIVNLADGSITHDSDPYAPTAEDVAAVAAKPARRTRMSFLTALTLSFNNLMTKKGRTIMTAFAGSIGIIGIAAILALANGVNNYIKTVEEDTLSVYPLQIMSTGFDMTSMFVGMSGDSDDSGSSDESGDVNLFGASQTADDSNDGKVHESRVMTRMFASIGKNDLAALKEFLDSGESGIDPYVNNIFYEYAVTPQIFDANTENGARQINPDKSFSSLGVDSTASSNSIMSMSMSSDLFAEMPDNDPVIMAQYDVMAGHWPESEDEMVLVLSKSGKISDFASYVLGLRDPEELKHMVKDFADEKEVEVPDNDLDVSYDDILALKLKLVNAADYYKHDDEHNVWLDKTDDEEFMKDLVSKGDDLKIAGIVRPKPDANAVALTSGIYYTAGLVDRIVNAAADSQIVKDQLANSKVDVFNGKSFDEESKEGDDFDMSSLFAIDEGALANAFNFDASALNLGDLRISSSNLPKLDLSELGSMDTSNMNAKDISKLFPELTPEVLMKDVKIEVDDQQKAQEELTKAYAAWAATSTNPTDFSAFLNSDAGRAALAQFGTHINTDKIQEQVTKNAAKALGTNSKGLSKVIAERIGGYYAKQMGKSLESTIGKALGSYMTKYMTSITKSMKSAMSDLSSAFSINTDAFASAFQFNMSQEELTELMTTMMRIEEHSFDNNLKKLGYADFAKPSEISIYPKDFEGKEQVIKVLDDYNERMRTTDEDKVISYTDIVGALMQSVTTIINMISMVLIAFVAISLIVSSIMIGVITYISVLERRKEIGILRSIGASKRDVSRVFNAETVIEGLIAGLLGVGVTALGCIPANIIVDTLFNVPNVALLPVNAAIILVAISVFLTFVAGLIPSGSASRKDPVEALRSE